MNALWMDAPEHHDSALVRRRRWILTLAQEHPNMHKTLALDEYKSNDIVLLPASPIPGIAVLIKYVFC